MKYNIIYADPPWRYGGDGGSKWRPASEYYDTMTFDELKNWMYQALQLMTACCLCG